MVHVKIVADFKEELVKRCLILVVTANSNTNIFVDYISRDKETL